MAETIGWILLLMIPYGNSSDQIAMQQFRTKAACEDAGKWFETKRNRPTGPKLVWECVSTTK